MGLVACALPFRESEGREVAGIVEEASVDGEVLCSSRDLGV